ncbi:hypothetical protein N9937_02175 [bacterium]|nr:hypothetical protein [bacterium]
MATTKTATATATATVTVNGHTIGANGFVPATGKAPSALLIAQCEVAMANAAISDTNMQVVVNPSAKPYRPQAPVNGVSATTNNNWLSWQYLAPLVAAGISTQAAFNILAMANKHGKMVLWRTRVNHLQTVKGGKQVTAKQVATILHKAGVGCLPHASPAIQPPAKATPKQA